MRLQQVVVNLLDNASKFTRDGGHIWLTLAREGDGGARAYAAVRVRDDGMGISRVLLPRIFELFTQGQEVSSERGRAGIGVGLSLVKSLVELHGGKIEAVSAGEALGSEFVLRLPVLDAARIPAQARGGKKPAGVDAPSRRILVVDDNPDVGDALRGLLAMQGHEAHIARDGADAVARASELRPDIVLLDISLPDVDGYEVARRLRALDATRHALILALTGFGQHGDLERSRAAGIDRHLTKPVDMDELEDCLRREPTAKTRGSED